MKKKQTETGSIRLDEKYFLVPLEHGYGIGKKSAAERRNFDFLFYDFDIRTAIKHYLEKIASEELGNGAETSLCEYVDKLSSVFENTLAEFVKRIEEEKGEKRE